MAFRTARSTFGIQHNYQHIWDILQGLSLLQGHVPHLNEDSLYLDWTFVRGKNLSMVSMSEVYHTIIGKHMWLENRVIKVWSFHRQQFGGKMYFIRVGVHICHLEGRCLVGGLCLVDYH